MRDKRHDIRHTTYDIRNTRYDFAGKTVLVMGLGRFGGGADVAEFAHSAGAKVIVTDLAPAEQLTESRAQLGELPNIEFHLGSHSPDDFEKADVIVANPAVAPDNEFLELARRHNRFITSQVGIFFELCPAPIIGITGANGKSTTAALTAHLLKAARRKNAKPNKNVIASEAKQSQNTQYAIRDTQYESVIASEAKQSQPTQYAIRDTQYEKVWLSGNIGNQPFLTTLPRISPNDLVVLELSSFQLEQLAQIERAPKIALLTNLTPNHLDRHGTFANYCAAKENIFKFQVRRVGFSPPNKTWWVKPHPTENRPAVSIFNAEDKIAAGWFEKYKTQTGRICIKFSIDDVSQPIRSVFPLPGRANLSNLAAAVAIARHFGVTDDLITSFLPDFKPLPHRLELVAQINGVHWYNDSIATTPQSAIAALEAFDRPKIIIAGGYDKNLPFDRLGEKIAADAKAAILLGRTAPKIAAAIRNAQMSLQAPQHLSLRGEETFSPERSRMDAMRNTNLSLRAKRSNLNLRNTRYAIRDTSIELVDSLADAVNLANRLAVSGDVVLLSPACASYDMFDNFQHRGCEFVKLVRQVAVGL